MLLRKRYTQCTKHIRGAYDADLRLLTVVACLDHQTDTMLLHAQPRKVHCPSDEQQAVPASSFSTYTG